MRSLVLGLCALLLALPASAGAPLPKIAKDTPYPTVRAQLIRMGYEPMRVRKARPEGSEPCPYPTDFCRAYPEVLVCAIDFPACAYLFRRRSDGLFMVVQTQGMADESVRPADFRGIRLTRMYRATKDELRDVIVSRPTR